MYEDQEDFRNSYCKSGPNNTNQSLEKKSWMQLQIRKKCASKHNATFEDVEQLIIYIL
jgi:hypothetical protein